MRDITRSDRRRWLYALVPLAILLLLVAIRFAEERKGAAEQAKMMEMRRSAPASVAATAAVRRDIVHTIETVGSIESPNNVRIASKVTGRIDGISVNEGDRITVGQVLVRIDPDEVEAEVRQKQAALAEARSRLAQAELNLGPTNVGVQSAIRQQQAQLASDEADLNQATESFSAQIAAAEASVTEAKGRLAAAAASVRNAAAGIKSAQATLANAEAKHNRIVGLYKEGFIAAQDVDDARTAVDVQRGALDEAREQHSAAESARDAASAQVQAAEKSAQIVRNRGQADIASAKARVAQAQAGLASARANAAQSPAFKQNIAALTASVAAARADLAASQTKRLDLSLRSPIDGYVTSRDMDPGAVATAGQAILVVQSVGQLWVTSQIPEEDSRSIRFGMPAEVRVDALKAQLFTGKVTQVNPSADPMSRQFTVRVTLPNKSGLLKPGMYARVRIVAGTVPDALVVPREAVRKTEEGSQVSVIEDGIAHTRSVETGASDSAVFQIVEGLREGERVITLSANPVRDGQKVVESGKRGGAKGGKRP